MKGCVQASKPLSVFALCERKPRSGLPSWLANALEVAIAVLTVTIHRGLVQQFAAWVGMPILMSGSAVPAVAVMRIFGWASRDVLRCCMLCIFPGAMNQDVPARSCFHHPHKASLTSTSMIPVS